MRWSGKLLRRLCLWAVRQSITTVVLFAAATCGWLIRSWTGPVVLSEEFSKSTRTPRPPGSKPQALRPRDPVAAELWADAASLRSPNQTLRRLRESLDDGTLSDFNSLARDLMAHPLRHFRSEALTALLTTWIRQDPGGALAFMEEMNEEELARAGADGSAQWHKQILTTWAAANPEEALRRVPQMKLAFADDSGQDPLVPLIRAVLSRGNLAERLRVLTATLGETALTGAIPHCPIPPCAMSAHEWRDLAAETKDPALTLTYRRWGLQAFALSRLGNPPTMAEMEAWIGDPTAVSALRNTVWSMAQPKDTAERLMALTPDDFSGNDGAHRAFDALCKSDPAVAVNVARRLGLVSLSPQSLEGLGRALHTLPTNSIVATFAHASAPWQQEALTDGMVVSWTAPRVTGQSLTPTLAAAAALGPVGEPLLARTLAGMKGESALQVPEVFSQQSPAFQSAHRLEIVAGLAKPSPQAAAEVWQGAAPEELSQPGMAIVSEEIARRFLQRDSVAASAWIGRLPPGVSRDRAVALMIESTAPQDPDTCAQWAATIQDAAALARAQDAIAVVRSGTNHPTTRP